MNAPGKHAHAWVMLRRHAIELLIVFVGVYLAFLLNRFDNERRDAQRKVLIVGALEREVSSAEQELEGDVAGAQKLFGEFDRALAAGEMPPVHISITSSGYSPTDDATLLQAGGLELLDIKTLELLREVNNIERALTVSIHAQFELEIAILANHEQADYYDPVTRQLRPIYSWYPHLQHSTLEQAQNLLRAERELLAAIRAQPH